MYRGSYRAMQALGNRSSCKGDGGVLFVVGVMVQGHEHEIALAREPLRLPFNGRVVLLDIFRHDLLARPLLQQLVAVAQRGDHADDPSYAVLDGCPSTHASSPWFTLHSACCPWNGCKNVAQSVRQGLIIRIRMKLRRYAVQQAHTHFFTTLSINF